MSFPYLNAWLQCLQNLTPCKGLLHIAAGGVSAEQYAFAQMPRLLVVDADTQQVLRLQLQLRAHSDCQVIHAVVAAKDGDADFHQLSQTQESGLCPPESLQILWPNIRTLSTRRLPTTTLQTLVNATPAGGTGFNWVAIDCLPALDLLCGAGKLPEHWDVVVIRALRDSPDQAIGLASIRQHLETFGLVFLAQEEENHPQVVRALFARNHTQEKSKLIADNAELTRAKAESLAQRDALAKEKAALTAARDEQAKLVIERDKLLTTSKQELVTTQERLQKLELENQEYQTRQHLLQDELTRAEAQIELIKDLLLREPGL